jgi:hypothetical protein
VRFAVIDLNFEKIVCHTLSRINWEEIDEFWQSNLFAINGLLADA